MGDDERRTRATCDHRQAPCAYARTCWASDSPPGNAKPAAAASKAANSSGERAAMSVDRPALPASAVGLDQVLEHGRHHSRSRRRRSAAVCRARQQRRAPDRSQLRRRRRALGKPSGLLVGRPATAADRDGRGSGRARCPRSRHAGRGASTRTRLRFSTNAPTAWLQMTRNAPSLVQRNRWRAEATCVNLVLFLGPIR